MHTRRWWLPALGLATTLTATACRCGTEEYAVTVSSPGALTVTGDGATRRIEFVTRLTAPPTSPATFQFVFDAVEGAAAGEGVALSLSGTDPATNEVIVLALALPTSLRRGDEYVVGATFAVEPGLNSDPRLWGAHDLRRSDQAEVAFSVASYSFPPPQFTTSFRAVASTGTIRVTQRRRGWVELAVNLRLTDAAGRTRTVTGPVQANSERYTPPCT